MPLMVTKKVGREGWGRKGVIRDCFSYGSTVFGADSCVSPLVTLFLPLVLMSGEWLGRRESRVMRKTFDANLSVPLE